MYKIFNSKVTPFGGIHLIHKQLFAQGAIKFIDNQLGERVKTVELNINYCIKVVSKQEAKKINGGFLKRIFQRAFLSHRTNVV